MDGFDAIYTNAYIVTDDQDREVVKTETFDVKCVQVFPPQQYSVSALCWIPAGTKYHCSSEEWKDVVTKTAYGPMNSRTKHFVEQQVVSNGEWITVDIKRLVPIFPKKSRRFL